MRTVSLTEAIGWPLWACGGLLLVGGLALAFTLLKRRPPHPAVDAPAPPRRTLRTLLGAVLWIVPLAAGCILLGSSAHHIDIDADGGWSVQNAAGVTLRSLAGDVGRSVAVHRRRADRREATSSNRATLTVTPTTGEVLEIDIDASAAGALQRLGYARGSHCADPTDPDRFPTHTFTLRGPWCPKAKRGAATSPIGDPVFARRSDDGWWYAARATDRQAGKVHVRFADGLVQWRKEPAEVGGRTLPSVAHLQADWGGRGKYFPCVVVAELGGGRYTVQYADGTAEDLVDEGLRFALPEPKDVVFAKNPSDGWWSMATVQAVDLQGLVVAFAGAPETSSKNAWRQVMPLQLPVGARVEVRTRKASVLSHMGVNVSVRFTDDSSEEIVSVRHLRFWLGKR